MSKVQSQTLRRRLGLRSSSCCISCHFSLFPASFPLVIHQIYCFVEEHVATAYAWGVAEVLADLAFFEVGNSGVVEHDPFRLGADSGWC